MDHERFRDRFSRVDELTAAQRKQVAAAAGAVPGSDTNARALGIVIERSQGLPR